MTLRLLHCLALTFVLSLAACSHGSSPEPDRPGKPPKEDPESLDPAMRITGDLVNFHYDDGGILFSRSTGGEISAVRLSDGLTVDYNPETPSLKLNGVDIAVNSAELLASKNGTEWHRITLSDRQQTVYIVVSL